MKRATVEQAVVWMGLVAATVGLRIWLREIPNFAPVAAVALFAGYYFRNGWLAALAPLSVMLISDLSLGGYQPLLMLTVYSLLTLPVLLRGYLRSRFQLDGSARSVLSSLGGLLTCSLACSLLFFAATNLVVWVVTPWYPSSGAGLLQCYANAIPFFRYTVAGDLLFAGLLFGAYAALQAVVRRRALAWHPQAV